MFIQADSITHWQVLPLFTLIVNIIFINFIIDSLETQEPIPKNSPKYAAGQGGEEVRLNYNVVLKVRTYCLSVSIG